MKLVPVLEIKRRCVRKRDNYKMKKINRGFDHWEEYELAPGLTMTIRVEGNNGLPEVVDRFLRHKASVPEMKKSLRAWSGPRRSDIASATSMGEK